LTGIETDPRIADGKADLGASVPEWRGAGMNPYTATLGELQRIAEQIEQDLAHAGRNADQCAVRAHVQLQLERHSLFAGLAPVRSGDALDHVRQGKLAL